MQQRMPEDPRKAAEAEAAAKEQRRLLLKQILTPAALERLQRVELVRPEKFAAVEKFLLTNARSLAGGAAITEEQLINLLEQSAESARGKVQIIHKSAGGGADDDGWEC